MPPLVEMKKPGARGNAPGTKNYYHLRLAYHYAPVNKSITTKEETRGGG